jgi:hypothetical protein
MSTEVIGNDRKTVDAILTEQSLTGKAHESLLTKALRVLASLSGTILLKAPLASPALTGNPTAPTQTAGNNSTRVATTAFVTAADVVVTTAYTTADAAVTTAFIAADAVVAAAAQPRTGNTFNVAGLPNATLNVGRCVYVTNGSAGAACAAISDGTNWKVVAIGATVSAT